MRVPLRATRAIIDLDRFDANVAAIRRRVGSARVLVLVKADAYGHGVVPIARRCEAIGVDMVGVANLEEAALLRDHGVTLPILVLEDLFPDEVEPALELDLDLSLSGIDAAERYAGVWAASPLAQSGRRQRVHLNLDLGMGRLGMVSDDPARAVRAVAAMPGLDLVGLFSHFPSSDEADPEPTTAQNDALRRVVDDLEATGDRPPIVHHANSGAILGHPAAAWDMVRPGLIAYGLHPAPEAPLLDELQPVMRLVSRVVTITRSDRARTIGYGRTWTAPPGTPIGVVPIGYGDGFPRALSNRGSVVVHGVRCPIVGRVSMDMITIDLRPVPEPVDLFDEVVVIGDQVWTSADGTVRSAAVPTEEVARLVGTIPYEITCDLTPRVPRVYRSGGATVAHQTMRSGYIGT